MNASPIQKADAALGAGRHAEAIRGYQAALEAARKAQAPPEERLFVNAGACLRQMARQEEAIPLLKEGLRHYPYSPLLHNNLANNLVDREGDRWETLHHYLMALRLGHQRQGTSFAAAVLLKDLNFPLAAYALIASWWKQRAAEDPPNSDTVRLLLELALTLLEDDALEPISTWCLQQLGSGDDSTSVAELLALMATHARHGDVDKALQLHQRAQQALLIDQPGEAQNSQLFINASWNLAILLLGQGQMQAGWKLYEYGLHTPAKGPQRWQRALHKLFSAKQVPLWRGEPLAEGVRLLLMAEQAVGDTMMFLQLLPQLLRRPISITLVVQPRLQPIYARSFPDLRVLAHEEAEHNLSADDLDLQCPVGSLPQHLLREWVQEGCHQTTLRCDEKQRRRLRRTYRQGLDRNKPLIGISWSGGGRRDRIRLKSLDPGKFGDLLRQIDARFVSLQYGDCSRQIASWQKESIDVIHDPEINPLDDMDAWMAQVAACDLVISVANTTVHGAALSGVPTLCLLSRSPDWRWVRSMEGSYWYDAVDVVRQTKTGSWGPALRRVPEWVEDRRQERFRVRSGQCHRHARKLSFQEWL